MKLAVSGVFPLTLLVRQKATCNKAVLVLMYRKNLYSL